MTLVGLLVVQIMAQGYAGGGQGMGRRGPEKYKSGRGAGFGGGFNGGMTAFVYSRPHEELRETEIRGLMQMREEEKLARLVNEGRISHVQALYVGAMIEDLDIFDLKKFIQEADNVDIKTVYQNS